MQEPIDAGVLEFSEWAVDILRRSNDAARRFNPDARVRLSRTGSGVRFALTDRAEPGDRTVEEHGFVLFVEERIEGFVDVVEPHDQLVLRPLGSAPNPREHHA
jgi:hypothetical protein